MRRYVAEVRRRQPAVLAAVKVPQTHPPGAEGEVDFGQVSFFLAGVQVEGWMFVFRLSASGRGFHRVYLNQAQQAFLDGHVRALEYMGGVPGRIRSMCVREATTCRSIEEGYGCAVTSPCRHPPSVWPVQTGNITRPAGSRSARLP